MTALEPRVRKTRPRAATIVDQNRSKGGAAVSNDDPGARPASSTHPRTAGGRISLAVVAEKAGVSEATVSRVMNRRYGVAQATREAVEQALTDLGYNQRVKGSIVLILTTTIINPFFAAVAEKIASELSPAGLRTVVASNFFDTTQERDHLDALIDARVAAVVFLAASNTLGDSGPVAEMVATRGVPFISVNSGFTDRPGPVVSVDEWHAAELAVNHLHSLGHRRIGLCAGPIGNEVAERRVDGFLQAMERRGLLEDASDLVVRRHFTVEGGFQAASQLLGRGISALVAGSDEMALGAIRAIRKDGLQVPDNISVVGFDDAFLLDFTDPPLTSVHLPVAEIGEHVAMLISTLMANQPLADEEVFIEPTFRVRSSTAVYEASLNS